MNLQAERRSRFPMVIQTTLTKRGLIRAMINIVTINHQERKEYPHPCHVTKCPNPGRYQLFATIGSDELPDWEGQAICSKHLVEEARHRPEIIMSLIDALIDAMEEHEIL